MKLSPTLILIRGLPGAGKSTLAELLFNAYLDQGMDVVHLAADDYMVDEKGEYKFDPNRLKECHDLCLADTISFMGRNYVVIVHNTFSRSWEAKPYLREARALRYPVQILDVSGPWRSVHNVPEATLKQMRERWEHDILSSMPGLL